MQDVYDEEKQFREKDRQAWIDYNREYGSYQEKRLAITQDYALKIAAAETEGEKAMLKRRREDELKELDFGSRRPSTSPTYSAIWTLKVRSRSPHFATS